MTKVGKALKFQSRIAEILNYTFQLMGRHIGQMLKSWALMLNPLNLIKRAFNDFMSYDIKWQRTMNVIKYNLRAILKPFMEWLAQQIVNVIGFLDIVSQKIQKAFGRVPVSLFDQVAADTEKTAEEIQDVTAGFDELHDIGSNNSGANDLLGEIYKPQLSPEWEAFAEKVGDIVGNISKYVTENWKTLLDKLLRMFIAWKLLKIAGKLLWEALASKFTIGAGTNLLKNLFTDANGVVGIGQNIGTLIAGGILTVISAMALKDAINSAWNQGSHDALVGNSMNLMDQQTGMDALKGALGGAGMVVGGGMIAAALGASVALGPLLAVAAGVAALAAVVVVGAEAWSYHAKQNKIANNEMLNASDYAEQAKDSEEKLKEVTSMVSDALRIKNTNQEKLNQLEKEYGISLEQVQARVDAAGGSTETLTAKELELYNQGLTTQKSIENYNKLLELQIKLQKQNLWQKEQEAIALDIEAGNYELAAMRIEQAELDGTITTEEATAKRIQLYKQAGKEERENLLQNLTPEQRELMLQYTNATSKELGELAEIWYESRDTIRNALLDGVGPETQDEFKRRMNNIDDVVKQHTGFWQGIGDTIAEILTLGNVTTWTYDGKQKYYEQGYGSSYKQRRADEILRDDSLSDEEKRKRIAALSIKSYAVGTNYVPSDGLAYLHQGEAVVPKKYNQPYQQVMSNEERAYMQQMISTMRSLDTQMKQGIPVNGQFVQRGSDLVAVVNKTKSQTGADLLSNVSYAR